MRRVSGAVGDDAASDRNINRPASCVLFMAHLADGNLASSGPAREVRRSWTCGPATRASSPCARARSPLAFGAFGGDEYAFRIQFGVRQQRILNGPGAFMRQRVDAASSGCTRASSDLSSNCDLRVQVDAFLVFVPARIFGRRLERRLVQRFASASMRLRFAPLRPAVPSVYPAAASQPARRAPVRRRPRRSTTVSGTFSFSCGRSTSALASLSSFSRFGRREQLQRRREVDVGQLVAAAEQRAERGERRSHDLRQQAEDRLPDDRPETELRIVERAGHRQFTSMTPLRSLSSATASLIGIGAASLESVLAPNSRLSTTM